MHNRKTLILANHQIIMYGTYMITKIHSLMIPGYDTTFATVEPSAVHSDQANLINNNGSYNTVEASKATWFHASNNPDVLTDITASKLTFHVGSKETAEDIGREYEDIAGGYFLHEIALTNDTKISSHFSPDLCTGWPNTVRALIHTLGQKEYNAIPYRNLYENFGSLSMIVDPSTVKVVSTRWVPFECYSVSEQFELFEEMAYGEDEFPAHYQIAAQKALDYLNDVHSLVAA